MNTVAVDLQSASYFLLTIYIERFRIYVVHLEIKRNIRCFISFFEVGYTVY